MTDDEIRHMNVLLEDIKQQVKLVFEGDQVLNSKIEDVRLDLKAEIRGVCTELKTEIREVRTELKDEIKEVHHKVKGLEGVMSKLTDLMDDHDKWLRDHEVRFKAVENR